MTHRHLHLFLVQAVYWSVKKQTRPGSNVSGTILLDTLENCFSQIDDELGYVNKLWFQQVYAPTHYNECVHDALYEQFQHRCIGRYGPYSLASREPGLDSIRFLLWGHIKHVIYSEKFQNLNHLKERIT